MFAPQAPVEAKLFVGNLPPDITVEELQYVFNSYGTVSKCHVMDAGKSKSGQACAFVTYDTAQAAAIAIQTLNNVYRIRVDAKEAITVSVAKSGGMMSEGSAMAASLVAMATQGAVQPAVPTMPALAQPLVQPALGQPDFAQTQPGFAQPGFAQQAFSLDAAAAAAQQLQLLGSLQPQAGAAQFAMPGVAPTLTMPGAPCKLFVGDLPGDIAKEAIQAVFSTYGTVTDVHLMTGKSRSGAACCLVEYSNLTEAQTAIATLHQKYEIRPGTGMITVRMFEGKGKGKGAGPAAAPVAAPLAADPLAAFGTALGAPSLIGLPQPDPAGLRYTPY